MGIGTFVTPGCGGSGEVRGTVPGTRWHSPFPTAKGTAQCPHDERAARTPRDRPDVVADVPGRATRPAVVRVRRRRHRDVRGAAARGHRRLRAAPGPGHHRGGGGPGPRGRGRGDPRRARHRAGLRRHRRRPAAGAGLRARPGALLRDGRASPRHQWPALRALRRGRPRDRQGDPHDGLAPGRRAGARDPRHRDPRGARVVRRGGQRLHRVARPDRDRRRVHPPRRQRSLLRARAVDARRLAGLAQGDGVGPARQHDRRGRPGAGQPRPHARGGGPALPRVPVRPAPADRGQRRRWSTASSSRTPPATRPATRAARRTPARWSTPSRACATRWPASPTWWAAATASAPTPGWSTASTARPARRCWPTTRTSASACPASGCRWACTAARSPPTARWTPPASRSPASRA